MGGFISSDGGSLIAGLDSGGVAHSLLVDGSGNLKIAGSITASSASTSATAAAVPAQATYVGGNKAGNLVGFSLDSSGYLNVNVQAGGGSNASVSTDGAAIPTSSTLIGASDGTNLAQLLVESVTNKNLRVGLYNGANELAINASGQAAMQIVDSAGTNVAGVDGSNRLKTIVSAALPAGSATIGAIKLVDTGGTNLLAIDASGRLTLIPNSSVNVAQIGGVAAGLDNTNELKVSLYGKSSAAGDTALGVDASGRLTSIIQAVGGTALAADQTNTILRSSLYVKKSAAGDTVLALGGATSANSLPVVIASDQGNVPANIAQWAGAAPSVSNPVITQDQIRNWINNGQGFSATSGNLTAGANTGGLSLFNPNASGKTMIIFSLKYMVGTNAYNQINYTTSDPALGTTVTPVNLKAANGTSSVAVGSSAVSGLTPAGTTVDMSSNGSNANAQALSGGQIYIVPANNGICFYSNVSSTQHWYASFAWVEI